MASKNTSSSKSASKSKSSSADQATSQSKWEKASWIGGLFVMFISLYVLVATIAYICVWKHDYALLCNHLSTGEPQPFSNVCGELGAVVGNALIGKSFGVFGMLLPFVGLIMGGLMFAGTLQKDRIRSLLHAAVSITLVTICGSLTLATISHTSETFGGGIGGEYGRAMVDMLEGHIGGVGMWLLIVVCWILTGIFISASFITFLKRTTMGGVERGKGLWASFKSYLERREQARAQKQAEESAALVNDAVEETTSVVVIGEQPTTPVEPTPVVPTPADVVVDVADETADATETTEEVGEVEQIAEVEDPQPSNITPIEVTIHTEGQLSSTEVDEHRPFNPDSTPDYKFPTVDYLVNHENGVEVTTDEIELNKQRIEETLGYFGVPIISMSATIGPTVTLYEIVQEPGVKIARVQGLEKDIAQSLKARGIRIIAPIPGKGTIGIEVPNINKETVSMRSAIQSKRFQEFKGELPVVIGRTIQNENFVFDLAKMPHLLVAGATGQGKSVGLNAILASLLYRKDPSQLKFVLIDPKMVEFSLYAKLEKHFLAKMESEDKAIVTDAKKAVYTLNSLCVEMENRLKVCGDAGARNIVEYNDLVRKRKVDATEIMPYIVVVIDEFADLIMTAKEVEQPVMRLAQKARAIGIHLIVATQRPDVKVITGTIKANFPARIAFRVMQRIDSQTIIDQPGAHQLIGRGDMLLSSGGELTRIQCAFVDTPEVRDIVEHISEQPIPYPSGTYLLPDYEDNNASAPEPNFGSESGPIQKFDEHFADVARDAVTSGRFSTSYIQSVYGVGFNRAGRITRQLEQAGIIGPSNGSKARDVRIYDLDSLETLLHQLGVE